MTPEQFEQQLKARLAALDTAELIYPVATKMQDDMSKRVFDDGVMGNGQSIGKYSKKQMYAGREQFHNKGAFRPQGKKDFLTGIKQKKETLYNINTRKATKVAVRKANTQRETMYLPNGYKELRVLQGDEVEHVNLTYTTDLRKDFDSKLTTTGDAVEIRISRVLNQNKIAGLTKKYGTTLFRHTAAEKEFYNKEVSGLMANYLNG